MVLLSFIFIVDPTVNVRAGSTNIIITPNTHILQRNSGSSIKNYNQYNYLKKKKKRANNLVTQLTHLVVFSKNIMGSNPHPTIKSLKKNVY